MTHTLHINTRADTTLFHNEFPKANGTQDVAARQERSPVFPIHYDAHAK